MKVRIDTGLCTGHGRCYTLAPDVFEADDRGYGSVVGADLPEELRAQAVTAAENCPEQAITIDD